MEQRFDIPNKLYFRIGEVSDIVGVKPYVLRYWETEFPDIRPSKSKSGQRLYKRRDVEMLLMVKELLYDKRFTIDGAKQRLREQGRDVHVIAPRDVVSNGGTTSAGAVGGNGHAAVATKRNSEQLSIPMTTAAPMVGGVVLSGDSKKALQKLRVDLEIMLRELQN
jgi:DNA-binding transcriptional MerR regulator